MSYKVDDMIEYLVTKSKCSYEAAYAFWEAEEEYLPQLGIDIYSEYEEGEFPDPFFTGYTQQDELEYIRNHTKLDDKLILHLLKLESDFLREHGWGAETDFNIYVNSNMWED